MTSPAFELPSAKNMTTDMAVSAFVPTPLFWEILGADSHDVVFGTRGSGKTMLLRMMSLQHLHAFAKVHRSARVALYDEKRFGLFIPLGLDWCVAYQDDTPATFQFFLDGVNLVSCDALLFALEFLLRSDVLATQKRNIVERDIAVRLSQHWFREGYGETFSLADLRNSLLKHQAILRDIWRGREAAPSTTEMLGEGFYFRSSALLTPLSDAMKICNPLLGLPEDHKWIVCLDELEDLKEQQAKAITTLLRGAATSLVIKITTLPYTIETAETAFSPTASAVDFRDFEIRRLQHDPSDKTYRKLVADILRKRIKAEPKLAAEKLAEKVFGATKLAQRAEEASPEFGALRMKILASADNQDSARKNIPAVAMRFLRKSAEGHGGSVAYGGWDSVVRASDGNPGMFVRILNAFALDPNTTARIPDTRQHEVLSKLAGNWHEWSVALYSGGANLHRLIDHLGLILSHQLHDRRVKDEEFSFEVNRFLVDLGDADPETVEAFKVGARHALFVAETLDGSVRYPQGRGVWRLSYALAPKYWLVLRRGRIVKLGARQLSLPLIQRRTTFEGLHIGDDFAPVEQIESSASVELMEV